ncbi:hypothetical protein SKAU_G00054850 [Synaphobranchus kaupii]|uniref:Uncharacterized protein n=1 Tax=Synaphobranchus kaupii TaxID=118154 RepID=A0A9Q1G3V2_SYNKA|nr:hypothetical protein SKAU_G00054850 [Synaphobranchus kaupii]
MSCDTGHPQSRGGGAFMLLEKHDQCPNADVTHPSVLSERQCLEMGPDRSLARLFVIEGTRVLEGHCRHRFRELSATVPPFTERHNPHPPRPFPAPSTPLPFYLAGSEPSRCAPVSQYTSLEVMSNCL